MAMSWTVKIYKGDKHYVVQCPNCLNNKLEVINTRVTKNGIRRRRECSNCGLRVSTIETIIESR